MFNPKKGTPIIVAQTEEALSGEDINPVQEFIQRDNIGRYVCWDQKHSTKMHWNFAAPCFNSDASLEDRIKSNPLLNIPKTLRFALDKQEGGNHYKDMAIQPVEYITKNKMTFIEGSIIKYISRHRAKNGKQDLEKAKHFIDLLIEMEYSE